MLEVSVILTLIAVGVFVPAGVKAQSFCHTEGHGK